ncbi:MAG: phenylalanine--tRNA ligase subunit beta [Bacteroidetes bacterium QS_9_68_14]|nr:MAG: phenylalanine--tRNA ligase subunit beta [Bacteroidetes bacterium QS_9_68_14]
MKISRNWLDQYVDTGLSDDALAETLTMGGLEVDAFDRAGPSLAGVVVGHVERVRPHPNADRLVLCDVRLGRDGASGPAAQIACGAPNVAAGQRVPVATPGTELMLPGGEENGERAPVTIERTELRGERSEGMICSAHELGIGEDASGIMVLAEDARVGQPLAEHLAARGAVPSDTVFNIDLTPNRPDAASHLGVARDLAALTAVGLRPRNAVVDVANFVMHECGQPLHTFDFSAVAGEEIVVRSAEAATPITTLDGTEREAPPGTLLICDAERPVALAGLMGGQNTEVTRETTDVLIESAYFDPQAIRRAAKALDLSTDASYRFERGVDRDGQVWAAARAAALIAEITGGEVAEGLVDKQPHGPPEPRRLALRPARANAVLGTDLSVSEMSALLTSVGVDVCDEAPGSSGEKFSCVVPSFRPDITREEDIIEEVARLHGYDQIPAPAHVPLPARPPQENAMRRLRRRLRARLAGLGLREIQTNSMLPTEQARRFLAPEGGAKDDVAQTLKPISEAMAALRPRLLPGALAALRFNRNRGQAGLRFFEFGHVFRQTDRPGPTVIPGYAEREALLLALSGPPQPEGWDTDTREADFYDAKGLVEHVLSLLRVEDVAMEPFGAGADPNFAYGVRLAGAEGTPLGMVGKVSEEDAARFDLEADVFAAELRWGTLVEAAAPVRGRRYEPPRQFPSVERDLAVVVAQDAPAGALQHTIEQASSALLAEARLFDVYAGEGVGDERKSLAFALRFQADRTLEDAEVDAEVERIVSSLADEHDATLRQ